VGSLSHFVYGICLSVRVQLVLNTFASPFLVLSGFFRPRLWFIFSLASLPSLFISFLFFKFIFIFIRPPVSASSVALCDKLFICGLRNVRGKTGKAYVKL